MKAPVSCFILALLLLQLGLGQDAEYPVATPTDQPDVVISPYDANRRLDVAGLEPGALAEDPVAKKIFRIPYSNPTKRYYEDYLGNKIPKPTPPPPISSRPNEVIPPPPIGSTKNQPQNIPEPKGPNAPSWTPTSGQLPEDLLNFIYAFNQNSKVNDADALLPFYADRLENYFGKSNISKSSVRSDRAAYIKRYPQREYVLDGPPVLLSTKGDIYEVMTRVRYSVQGSGRIRSGAVSDYYKIRRGNRFFEIISIDEAKAAAAPAEIQQQDEQRSNPVDSATNQPGQGTVYSRFEAQQLGLFLDAFAASGEVNEPSAMLDFLHPQVSIYYSMSNPKPNQLLKDRRDYINRWPERRYWLTERPIITPLTNGSWDIITKTGYEVKNGSKTGKGVATSLLRVTHTNGGLKIRSIKNHK